MSATNASAGYVPPEQQVIHYTQPPQQQQQQQQTFGGGTFQPRPLDVRVLQEAGAVAARVFECVNDGPARPDNSAMGVEYSVWPHTKYLEVGCKFRKGPDGRTAVGACIKPGCKMTAEMYRLMCTGVNPKK